MTSGGARTRSGPQADPNSGRSDRRGFKLDALPSEGFQGVVPDFPLPFVARGEDGEDFRSRELEVWVEAWRTPQACAWSLQSWRWPILGEYCRLKTVVELDPSASAALVSQLHRYRDQLGLTPGGLKDNGWAIAADEIGARRTENADLTTTAPVRRMRAVSSD